MKDDLISRANTFRQEGTARNQRNPDSLNPDKISIDDRRLEDFIIYARQYSKNLLFVDAGDEPVDFNLSWEAFFQDGSLVLNAYIATKDLTEIKTGYDFLFHQFETAPTVENFVRIIDLVFERFRSVDEWFATSSPERRLNQELYRYIKSDLSKELQKLIQIISYINNLTRGLPKKSSIAADLINKDNVWEFTDDQSVSLGENLFAGNSDQDKLFSALLFINRIFDSVFHATVKIIDISRDYFREDIYNQQMLSPHLSLFVTFIRLFGIVQQEQNKIPGRLLGFYYKDVLRIRPRTAVPDQANILFELVKGFDLYKIDKGTALLAGKDDNKVDIIYTTDKDIIVNKARVSAVKTLFIRKLNNNLVSKYFVNGIKENEALIESTGATTSPAYPAFGAPGVGQEVRTGFAIASSQLYLSKGERSVTIVFETQNELIFQEWSDFDLSILELRLTGEKGWLTSNEIKDGVRLNYLKKTGANTLELSFGISIAQASAITGFDPAVHDGGFKPGIPVLKILLQFPDLAPEIKTAVSQDDMSRVKQINFLMSLKLVSTTIRVQVGSIGEKVTFDGITDLLIENHDSQLNPKKPFYPFTVMPKVGSSFYIGCYDLFYKKNIENLTVNIDWMLPDNFYSYYDKYFPPYDSNKFQASVSVLRNRNWSRLKDVSIIDSTSEEPRFRVIKVPARAGSSGDLKTDHADVSKFDVSKEDGTLKLKLLYPDFGHDIYPQLITSIAMEKAASKMDTVDFFKVIKKEMGDSDISIKLPPPGDENDRVPVLLNVLSQNQDPNQTRSMLIDALNFSLVAYNGVVVPPVGEQPALDPTRRLVNDDNFVERVLRFLRKVKLIDRSIHFDQDKDTVGSVVDDIDTQLTSRIDFILPADQEMISVIVMEVNSSIRKVVVKVVDKLIETNKVKTPDQIAVTAILKKEIDAANQVINDLVARKIATLLSAHDVPPKPYIPLINTISISYTSTRELNKEEDQLFQLLPFGMAEISPSTPAGDMPAPPRPQILPTNQMFPRAVVSVKENEITPSGILFIGLRDIVARENLTLYFQIDQSTKKSDRKPPYVTWRYLKNSEWIQLRNDFIVSDTTYGLQQTGILEFSIPPDMTSGGQVFAEPGLFWFSAAVNKDLDSFPDLTDIVSQAVSVHFEPNPGNDLSRLAFPLPANKITRLADVVPGIKSIHQPAASFGGKMEEAQPEFYARVSERLRHKSRSVNNWDYERLILEHFPSIYKVKCLNDYFQGQFVPGHVTVVPVLNLKNKGAPGFQSELPSASYRELRLIEQYVNDRSSVFARVHAINPKPEYVLINCKVKFKNGFDRGYHLQKLNEDLVEYLTPWAGDSATTSFSAKIYSSSIITFIDRRFYVDYVSDLSMNQYTLSKDGEKNFVRLENQLISLVETNVSTPHSILVSARQHNIELI